MTVARTAGHPPSIQEAVEFQARRVYTDCWECASNKLSADHTDEILDSLHIEVKEDGDTASLVSCILATDRHIARLGYCKCP